jgi:hypothetical protein
MTSQSILYHNNLVQIKKAHKTSHKDKKNIVNGAIWGNKA